MTDMLKLQTPVAIPPLPVGISFKDKIMTLGSCFADEIGRHLSETGFDTCVNPFGPLYNPVSLCNAVARLSSGIPFTEDDCVEIGAGDGRICSFSHHTSFARETPEAFLEAANAVLETASAFWKECNKVLITLGTSWCFRNNDTGETVANCLKRPAAEFTRYALSLDRTVLLLGSLLERNPDKQFIITVSPIRHLSDGAHANQLSKATLLLAVDRILNGKESTLPALTTSAYFPAYEIMMDELRDYRWWAEDMVHPSPQAIDYLWERFIDATLPDEERDLFESRSKAVRAARHIPLRH